MGYFSELEIEVQDRLFEGMSISAIATDLKLSLEEVQRIALLLTNSDYDIIDTDADPDLEYGADYDEIDYNAEHY